jgi:hypothetical protein
LEAGVVNDYFLGQAPRPLIDASIQTAEQLAPNRESCQGVEAA